MRLILTLVLLTACGQETPIPELRDSGMSEEERATSWLDAEITVSIGQRRFTQTRRELGASLAPAEMGARNSNNLPYRFDAQPALAWLTDIKRDVDVPARNAHFDAETRRAQAHRDGTSLDVWTTLERIDDALQNGTQTVRAELVRIRPQLTQDDLARARVDVLLARFDTPYDGSGDAANRTHNLRLGASHVDGTVLLPGEVFDFNAVVGERSLARGFKQAPVIAAGELVDGVGGGACQLAGTLHAAAYFSGLEIVDRTPHSRPSTYIRLGLDAAVAWPRTNFRFRNNLAFPIWLRLFVQGGKVVSEVWGREVISEIAYVRRVEEATPFRVREIPDDSLPAGARVLSQRGVPGLKISRTREFLRGEQVLRSEESEDIYPATEELWRVGTATNLPSDFVVPAGDSHHEYTADEYLRLLWHEQSFFENRRPGRTGVAGWSESLRH